MDEYFTFTLSFLSGVALLVFGIQNLSLGLQALFSKFIKIFVNSMDTNPVKTFFLGGAISFFVQSGSSVSTMSLSYASSGLLNFNQLISIFLGSHFGTLPLLGVFTLDLSSICFLFITVGFLPMMSTRFSRLAQLGKFIFSLGLMCLGYVLMVEYAEAGRRIFNWDLGISSSFAMFWFLGLTTVGVSLFVRSTMALLVTVMALLYIGGITQIMAFIFVVGINLGKSINVFLYSSKKNRTAQRGALFHLFTQLLFVILISTFFIHFYNIVISVHKPLFESSLSFVLVTQFMYGVGLLFLTLGLFVPLKSLVKKCIKEKEKKDPQKLLYSGPTQWMSPVLAIEQVHYEVKKMSATIESCLGLTKIYMSRGDDEARDKILKYENVTDYIQKEVFEYLDRIKEVALNKEQGQSVRALFKMADEFESMADGCKMMVLSHKETQQAGKAFDRELSLEFEKLFEVLIDLYEVVFSIITDQDLEVEDLSLEFRKKASQFEQRMLDLRKSYLEWLKKNASSLYEADAGLKFNDILNSLKKVKSHIKNVFEHSSIL